MPTIAIETAKVYFWQGMFFSLGFGVGVGILFCGVLLIGAMINHKKQVGEQREEEQKVYDKI